MAIGTEGRTLCEIPLKTGVLQELPEILRPHDESCWAVRVQAADPPTKVKDSKSRELLRTGR